MRALRICIPLNMYPFVEASGQAAKFSAATQSAGEKYRVGVDTTEDWG